MTAGYDLLDYLDDLHDLHFDLSKARTFVAPLTVASGFESRLEFSAHRLFFSLVPAGKLRERESVELGDTRRALGMLKEPCAR